MPPGSESGVMMRFALISMVTVCALLGGVADAEQKQPSGASQAPPQAVAPLTISTQENHSKVQERDRENHDRPQKAEEDAARRQAVAAERANALSIEALRWNQISVLGLLVSLVFTAWAALSASRATRVAEQSISSFIRLERARIIVSVDNVKIGARGLAEVDIAATNIGRSACVIKGIHWAWQASSNFRDATIFLGPPRDEFVDASKRVILGFIGKGDISSQPFLRGIVRYADPFGTDHLSYFCFQIFKDGDGRPNNPHARDAKTIDWPSDT